MNTDPTPFLRRPAWWLVLALGVALGGTALAAAVATDTREFAACHGAFVRAAAL